MKRASQHAFHIVLMAFAFAALSGCMAEVLTVTAIQGELAAQNAKAATTSLEYAKEKTGSTTLRKAIDTYQGETGAYPPTLDTLVPNYLGQLPKTAEGGDYYYDAATGQFGAQPFASNLIPDGDKAMMDIIKGAIQSYRQQAGYYPQSLQALVQARLLNYVPMTADGQAFVYNPQAGTLLHPIEAQTPSAGGGAQGFGGGAGAGPLGEVNTSIGISNQLDSMSTSGVSAVGTRGREGVRGTSGSYSDRQMKAIDNLDL